MPGEMWFAGECPVCPGFGGLVFVQPLEGEEVLLLCPSCGGLWDKPPPPDLIEMGLRDSTFLDRGRAKLPDLRAIHAAGFHPTLTMPDDRKSSMEYYLCPWEPDADLAAALAHYRASMLESVKIQASPTGSVAGLKFDVALLKEGRLILMELQRRFAWIVERLRDTNAPLSPDERTAWEARRDVLTGEIATFVESFSTVQRRFFERYQHGKKR